MKKVKNSEISFHVTNIYNTNNKSSDELKKIFNQKFLKTIYNLEKHAFYEIEEQVGLQDNLK